MREFTQEDAIRLIAKMRAYYGKKFADQWAGVDPKDIAESMGIVTGKQIGRAHV